MSSYQIYSFDGVPLPLYNPEVDLSTGTTQSTLLESIGGMFDVYGLRQRLPSAVTFSIAGVYAQSDGDVLLTDHTGALVVTEGGASIRAALASQWLRWQVDTLKAMIGKRANLYRRRWDDLAVIQSRLCRLLSVTEKASTKQRTAYSELEMTFETAMAAWRSWQASTVSTYLPGGGSALAAITNDGNMPVEDATIQVTAGQYVHNLEILCPEIGVDLRWTGTLPSSNVLLIDCGAHSVNQTTGPAYSGFTLGPGHTAREWLPLAYGINMLTISADDTCIVDISHQNQWA